MTDTHQQTGSNMATLHIINRARVYPHSTLTLRLFYERTNSSWVSKPAPASELSPTKPKSSHSPYSIAPWEPDPSTKVIAPSTRFPGPADWIVQAEVKETPPCPVSLKNDQAPPQILGTYPVLLPNRCLLKKNNLSPACLPNASTRPNVSSSADLLLRRGAYPPRRAGERE